MTKRTKRNLPTIYLDEHIAPEVTEVFKSTFRIVEISKSKRFKGRDELEYLPDLYAENGMFVTSDMPFVNAVRDNHIRHAGIVYIPNEIADDEKIFVAELISGFVRGACSASRFGLRNRIIYPGYDGIRSSLGDKDELEFSWGWLSQMMDID